jgi:4,5-dihydroxyphthalate decarboxylase
VTQAARPHITIGLGYRYDSIYVRNGVVDVPGFEVEYFPRLTPDGKPVAQEPAPAEERTTAGGQPYVAPAPMFTDMVNNPPYDVGELAFSTYVQAVDYGRELIALPIVTSRYAEHNQVYVHQGAGISGPADLAGKRINVGSFAINPAVWLRGMLTHQYDVPTETITWVEDRHEHITEYRPPRRYIVEQLPKGESVAALVESGRIDAVSRGKPIADRAPALRPLFEDPYSEVRAYYEANGFLPINTVVVMPRRTIEKAPGLPEALLGAFQRAFRMYLDDVRSGKRDADHSGLDLQVLEQAGIALPNHGLKANRDCVRTMVHYCYAQGIIRRLYEPEELFLLPDS